MTLWPAGMRRNVAPRPPAPRRRSVFERRGQRTRSFGEGLSGDFFWNRNPRGVCPLPTPIMHARIKDVDKLGIRKVPGRAAAMQPTEPPPRIADLHDGVSPGLTVSVHRRPKSVQVVKKLAAERNVVRRERGGCGDGLPGCGIDDKQPGVRGLRAVRLEPGDHAHRPEPPN